jgi:cobalt-zinc-cadmium efflux system membrane fusion protein
MLNTFLTTINSIAMKHFDCSILNFKRLLHPVLSSFFIFLFIEGCGTKAGVEEKEISNPNALYLSREELSQMEIHFVKPGNEALETYTNFNGKVKSLPNLRANVSSNIQGKVEKIYVYDGEKVRKGQVLMTLISNEFIELQENYLSAKSELDFLHQDYLRQEELKENNVGALSAFQRAESKYKGAASRVNSLEAKLELLGMNTKDMGDPAKYRILHSLEIKSPINGYLYKLPVTLGMIASPEITLAEIIDVNDLFAEVYVYDKDIDLIREGQDVEIEFINNKFKSVTGKVYSIDRSIDENTKAVSVNVRFKAPAQCLVLPDMNIRATITSRDNEVKALTVPLSALIQEEDHYYVLRRIIKKIRVG